MSEVVEQVSHTVSTLIDFTGYFHKLYLSGKPYTFIKYFSSLCICKAIFFLVMLGVGSIWQSFEVWNLNVPDFAAVARHRVVVVILWCSRCRPSHPSIMLYRMECLSAFPEGLAGWKVSVGQTPLIPTTIGKVGGILWKLNSSSGISLLLWDRKETSVQAGQAATYLRLTGELWHIFLQWLKAVPVTVCLLDVAAYS